MSLILKEAHPSASAVDLPRRLRLWNTSTKTAVFELTFSSDILNVVMNKRRLLVVLGDESCRPCQRCAVLGLKALLAAGYELSPKQLALAGEVLGRRPNFRHGLLGGVTTTDARHRLVVHRVEIKYSTRLQCARMRRFRREPFFYASRAR